MPKMDFVFVKELAVRTISGVDAWKRPQTQPLSISIFINSNFRSAAQTDHLKKSLNYDVISRTVVSEIEAEQFRSITHVADSVAKSVLKQCNLDDWARISVKKPRHLLRADSAEAVITRQLTSAGIAPTGSNSADLLKINALQLVTIIGVNNIERLHRQNVVIDLTLYKPLHASPEVESRYDAVKISEIIAEHVENATYKTLEAFTESIAHIVISCGIERVNVSAAKPSALTWAKYAGIEVSRTRGDYDELLDLNKGVSTSITATPVPGSDSATMFPQTPIDPTKPTHTVYLAFGTNIGDCLDNIQQAATLLEKNGIKILRTSSIYKSQPMYVLDQQEFYNGVFACETAQSPLELLKTIKQIEYDEFKRQNLQRNGPRPMDIDILLYDDAVMNSPELTIPHIDMLNRTFVLQPLIDVATADLIHPLTAEPFSNHLAQIPVSSENQKSSAITRIVPCPGGLSLELDPITHTLPTQIMAILNGTPDSFSDGGDLRVDNCISIALEHVKNGATILDVGGLSTRPGSEACSVEEETKRVVDIIRQLRTSSELNKILISVDTYRSQVAKAALEAGANIINDVFGGQMDPEILRVARDFKAPIVLMHSRGNPSNMSSLTSYPDGLVQTVGREIESLVTNALEAGISRWQIILDPGYGFAKNKDQNLELIRNFKQLQDYGTLGNYPWLVGTSRKRFIGTLTGESVAKDRDVGTAATTTVLVQQGADIVRVHNSKITHDTVKIADAIYRDL